MTATTLREIASRCRQKVYIGAAILPRPLFVLDYDDDDVDCDIDDGDCDSRAARSGGDAAAVGIRPRIGCATISTVDRDDETSTGTTRYSEVLSSEFNSVVIEHHLKWSPLVHALPGPISQHSTPETTFGRYDFRHVDSMVDWALSRNMHVKGHVLIWHVTSPPFLEDMSPDDVRDAVKRHIFATMGYFRDRITMWDVVNEALASDGTLVENVFYRKMGPGYIAQCFRWAHEANPHSFLIYNDNKVEGCGVGIDGGVGADGMRRRKAHAPNQAKSDGYYRLLKSLVDDGVPIHGAGMQAHIDASGIGRNRPPTPSMVGRQIRRIGELGLKVNISEMDVRVSRTREGANRDMAQACIYRDILAAALSESCFHGIWLWGFTDRHTWVKNFYHDDAPLIFDDMYARKMSYWGVDDALRSIAVPNDDDGGGGAWYLESDYDVDGNEWGCEWMTQESEPEGGELNDGERNVINGRDTTKEGLPDWLQPS
jgi:endo-1,4-beta-xylanase